MQSECTTCICTCASSEEVHSSVFFVSVVPPAGGALSLLKMHSVAVRPCSLVLSILKIHTVNADASYRTQRVTKDYEMYYMYCML